MSEKSPTRSVSAALTGDDDFDDEDTRRRDDDDVDPGDPPDDDEAGSSEADEVDEVEADNDLEPVSRGVVRRTQSKRKSKKAPKRAQAREFEMEPSKRKPQNTTQSEIPREEIVRMSSLYDRIRLEIRRKLPSGKWARIKSGILIPPAALFDVGEFVRHVSGGGTYIFDVTSTNDRELLCPRWEETIDGAMTPTRTDVTIGWDDAKDTLTLVPSSQHFGGIPAALAGPPPAAPPPPGAPFGAHLHQPHAPPPRSFITSDGQRVSPSYDHQGRLLPPPPAAVPKWVQTFDPQTQWNVLAQSASPDPVAKQWIAREMHEGEAHKATIAQLTERLAHIEKTHQTALEKIREEAAANIERAREDQRRAERELERERADARYAALEAKLTAMTQQPTKPSFSLADLAGVVTALAPIASTFISTRSESDRTVRSNEMQLITALATKKDSNFAELIAPLAGVIGPLVLKWMENTGPQAQAELHQIEHEQRMMHLKMLADMLGSMAPAEDPAWKQVIDTAVSMFGGFMQQKQMQALAAGGRSLPSGPAQAQAQAQGQQVPQQAQSDIWAQLAEQDPAAAQTVRLVYQHLPEHLGFHTHEWVTILFNAHIRLDPAELAEVIVRHLVNCDAFSNLPQPLADVFTKPRESFEVVFRQLPIAQQDPAYVEAVIDACVAEIANVETDIEGDDSDDGAESTGANGTHIAAQG